MILLFAYKALSGLTPAYLADIFIPYKPINNLSPACKHYLNTPCTLSKTCSDRAFMLAAPWLWNELPEFIQVPWSFPGLPQDLLISAGLLSTNSYVPFRGFLVSSSRYFAFVLCLWWCDFALLCPAPWAVLTGEVCALQIFCSSPFLCLSLLLLLLLLLHLIIIITIIITSSSSS